MRSLAIALGLASLLAGPSARAGLLQFESLLEVEFSNLGGATASTTGSGVVQVNGAGSLGPIHSLTFVTVNPAKIDTTIPVTEPTVAVTIPSVRFTAVQLRPDVQGNELAPISGVLQNTTSALTRNTVAFGGNVRICLFFAGCNSGHIDLPLGDTSLGVVVGPGVGGTVTGASGEIRVSLVGAPWTVGTVSISDRTDNSGITILTLMGYARGPAGMPSTAGLPGGVVQFVSANQVTALGVPGSNDISGQFLIHRLHFVPEPGALVLLGGGALTMLVLGQRRARR